MLDYFNNRQNFQYKAQIKRHPDISFGLSIDTPKEFQKEFTMISRNTFINPHLPFDNHQKISKLNLNNNKNNRTLKIKGEVEPNWTKKIDMNQIQTQISFINRKNQSYLKLSPQNRYFKELSQSKTRFRLTKGQFTNFLQKGSSRTHLFGPLIGKQRDSKKYLLTKSRIAQQSFANLSRNFDKLQNYNKRYVSRQTPLDIKYSLQKNRLSFRQNFKSEIQNRRQFRQNSPFLLPHLSSRTICIGNKSSRDNLSINNTTIASLDINSLQNPQNLKGLLSNKSIQKLNDLKQFTYMKNFYTLDLESQKNEKNKQKNYKQRKCSISINSKLNKKIETDLMALNQSIVSQQQN